MSLSKGYLSYIKSMLYKLVRKRLWTSFYNIKSNVNKTCLVHYNTVRVCYFGDDNILYLIKLLLIKSSYCLIISSSHQMCPVCIYCTERTHKYVYYSLDCCFNFSFSTKSYTIAFDPQSKNHCKHFNSVLRTPTKFVLFSNQKVRKYFNL
jgi:hypothetical protein